MIRYIYAFMAVACLIIAPAWAGENHNADIGFSNSKLVKSNFAVGKLAGELFADGQIDTNRLIADLDLSQPASIQAIADRINARRKALYPDEEIILSLTVQQDPRAAVAEKIGLVRAIYWWNNTNCFNCSWYAQYTSTVATMFIDDIQYGAYNIYDKVGNSNWVFRYLLHPGDSATRYSTGASTLRGFQGAAAGVASKADIVMYFFR